MNKIISLWDVFWPFFKRKFWYALLLVSSTLYLGYNRFAIVRLDDSSLISAVFLVWIILLLFPLFSELEFLGIKIKKEVKKEVEKNNEELKSTIHLLQGQISQIQIATGIANRISITNETMSLEELKKLVSKVGNQENPNHKSEKRKNVPAPVIEMFEIRYEIECELKRLCQKKRNGTALCNYRKMYRRFIRGRTHEFGDGSADWAGFSNHQPNYSWRKNGKAVFRYRRRSISSNNKRIKAM